MAWGGGGVRRKNMRHHTQPSHHGLFAGCLHGGHPRVGGTNAGNGLSVRFGQNQCAPQLPGQRFDGSLARGCETLINLNLYKIGQMIRLEPCACWHQI